jgi:uncharacterized protein (DUF1684 family)
MTDHDHGAHDDHEHHEHEHHEHELSWADELAQLRDAARHHYLHQFDWKRQGPPPGFDGPRFFEPDEAWVRDARLDRSAPGAGQPVELATSTGQIRNMTVAGLLVFEAGGTEHRLTGFVTHGADGYEVLFVPFRDATSGYETYGAGRYLEVAYEPDQETVELDFNYAYNPSCVYSTAYDCPYPPPANRLAVPVRAGEMMPAQATDH